MLVIITKNNKYLKSIPYYFELFEIKKKKKNMKEIFALIPVNKDLE